MNTVFDNTIQLFSDNLIAFPGASEPKKRRTNSAYKSNGVPKAKPADPIRRVEDIHAMQRYWLDKGSYRNYMLITLGISLGIRISDLLNIKLRDIVDEAGQVKSHCYIYEKKTRKLNQPGVNSVARKVVEGYLKTLTTIDPEDYLFKSIKYRSETSCYRKALTIQQANNIIKEAAKAVGVRDHISTHSLRKTFVYHTLRNNRNDADVLATIQYMLNHDSLATTLIYCGLEKDKADELREDIGGILAIEEDAE